MTDSWDSIDRYVVISSDTHAGAELHEYRDYLDPEWHERAKVLYFRRMIPAAARHASACVCVMACLSSIRRPPSP